MPARPFHPSHLGPGEKSPARGTARPVPAERVYTIRARRQRVARVTSNPGGSTVLWRTLPTAANLLGGRDPPIGGSSLVRDPVSGASRADHLGLQMITRAGPDGRTIVFGTNGALYRVGPDGRAGRDHQDAYGPLRTAFDVSFSPGGDDRLLPGSPDRPLTARAEAGRISSPREDHPELGSRAPRPLALPRSACRAIDWLEQPRRVGDKGGGPGRDRTCDLGMKSPGRTPAAN